MKYPIRSSRSTNHCLECNEPVSGKRRFCNDEHQLSWLNTHHPWFPDWKGAMQVEQERQRKGITLDAIEWRRKVNVSRPFA